MLKSHKNGNKLENLSNLQTLKDKMSSSSTSNNIYFVTLTFSAKKNQ